MASETISIRQVRMDDIGVLQQIATTTFINTYAFENTEEDMQNYLSKHFSKKALLNQLKNPDSLFYFAEMDSTTVGYLKLNKGNAQTESNVKNALEIERIYVLVNVQGRKIGHKLIAKTLELAKVLELNSVWLGVWDRNLKAIEFYKKNGFESVGYHSFMLGNDKQRDVIMTFKLRS